MPGKAFDDLVDRDAKPFAYFVPALAEFRMNGRFEFDHVIGLNRPD